MKLEREQRLDRGHPGCQRDAIVNVRRQQRTLKVSLLVQFNLHGGVSDGIWLGPSEIPGNLDHDVDPTAEKTDGKGSSPIFVQPVVIISSQEEGIVLGTYLHPSSMVLGMSSHASSALAPRIPTPHRWYAPDLATGLLETLAGY